MNSRIRTWRTGALCIVAAGLIAAPAFAANRVRSTQAAAPTNGVYQVKVLDAAGNPVQQGVAVYSATGQMIKSAQPVNGIIEIVGQAGQKFMISAGDSISLNGGSAAGVVLGGDPLAVIEAKLRTPTLSAGDGSGEDVGGDSCANATVIASMPYTDSDSVGGGPTDPDLPGQACGNANNWGGDVEWYQVTGNGNTITADTCATLTDTTLSVFLACGPNGCDNLDCVGGGEDDCGPNGFSSRVVWPSVNGQVYKIAVQGFANGFVNYTLNVNHNGIAAAGGTLCKGACCTCLNEPFNCQQENSPQCAALGGDFQGDGSGCCTPNGVTGVFAGGGVPAAITDGNTTTSTASGGALGAEQVADVDVQIDLTHTFVGDLQINAIHAGINEDVWDNRCGSWDNMHATADYQGTETFCTVVGAGPSSVVHYAQGIASFGNLTNFECTPSGGDWSLAVADQFGGDQGTLTAVAFHVDQALAICVGGGGGGDCEGKKAKICHIPQGNPDNAHVIEVGQPAVAPHKANHGDCDPPAGAEKGDSCTCP